MKNKSTKIKVRRFQKSFVLFLFCTISLVSFSQTTHQVSVTSNVFTPSELSIHSGDKVVWTNTQGTHNVNGTQSSFPENPESFGNNVGSGWTYEYTFITPGTYNYQCDPHVSLGMTGVLNVMEAESFSLTINFSNMTPHIGQQLSLLLIDKENGNELKRVYRTVEENFSVNVPGIMAGHSYEVDFFSDHNGNGSYDAPPVDHAWRLDLDNVSGDESLNFSHNTEFKDIGWIHKVFVNFSSMTPHIGEN